MRSLVERLRGDGLKVWSNEWECRSPVGAGEGSRKPGEGRRARADSIPAKIEEGLEHVRVLVLCLSVNALGSNWAQLEAGTCRFRDLVNKQPHSLTLD